MKITSVFLSVFLLSSLSKGQQSAEKEEPGYTRPLCRGSLNWAPLITTKPYTALLNSGYCPSWTTRHIMTKQRQRTHINLPYGVPFGFLCGACYTGSTDLSKTLTLVHQVDGDAASPYTIQQRPIKASTGATEHIERGHKCMMQYGITQPIKYGGDLTCQVRLGRFSYDEIATYSVVNIPVTKTEETMEVSEPTVTLNCLKHSEPENLDNPLTHVWYEQTSAGPRMVAPTNNPTVAFRLSNSSPLVVSCATYHIVTESIAYEITYTVRRISTGSWQADPPKTRGNNHNGNDKSVQGEGSPGDSYNIYGEDQVGDNLILAGRGVNSILIIIVATICVIAVIALMIGIMRIRRSRRNRDAERTIYPHN